MRFHQQDNLLIKLAPEKPEDYSIKQFYGTGKMNSLICKHRKIEILKQIQKKLAEYNDIICHPDKTRTKLYISKVFHWKGFSKSIHGIC